MGNTCYPASHRCYSLHKVYPKGGKFYIGHFRAPYDYEAEVEWLDAHEPDPEPVHYEAHEESDFGIKDICDSGKYAAKLSKIVQEKWKEQQKISKEYDEWIADLDTRGLKPQDLSLIERRWPKLFSDPTISDLYVWYSYDSYDMKPRWFAEEKRVSELIAKAKVAIFG